MQSAQGAFEPYHTHLIYTLIVTMLAWFLTLWYSRRSLRDRPSQRVMLYGAVMGLPLAAEAGAYALALLRPALDTWSGSLISRLHLAVLAWLPIDDLLDFALTPGGTTLALGLLSLLGFGSLARGSYGALQLRRLFARARPLDQTRYAAAARELRKTLAVPARPLPPILVLASDRPIACTVGVLRPQIYVATGLLELLAPDELVAVLCHEWAHILRGDLLWNWLVRLLRDTLCFLPGSHLLWRSMLVSQDEACDELAAQMTRQPLALARALVKVAQAQQHSRAAAQPAVNLLAPANTGLRPRVEQMLRLSQQGHATPTRGAYVLMFGLWLLGLLPVLLGC